MSREAREEVSQFCDAIKPLTLTDVLLCHLCECVLSYTLEQQRTALAPAVGIDRHMLCRFCAEPGVES